MPVNKQSTCNSFYVILSGLFRYDKNKTNISGLQEDFYPWQKRINNGEFSTTFAYLNSSYYDSYTSNMFPEIRHRHDSTAGIDSRLLTHLTLKSCLNNPEQFRNFRLFIKPGVEIPFRIEYMDLFLFPNDLGIFSAKVLIECVGEISPDVGTVSDFLSRIRLLNAKFTDQKETQTEVGGFFTNQLLHHLKLDADWNIYTPQLKTYVQIDLAEEFSEKEVEQLLFDIGNVSPIGSAGGEGMFAPSEDYYNQQIAENKICVFRNWWALSLFDTFTRVSIRFPDSFKSWENDYFLIYIHCLHIKFFLYITNSELSDITIVTSKTKVLRDRFIEFINDNYHSHISYKFLPNLIKDKLMFSLEIPGELEKMETKINRINDYYQEKREQTMNIVLLVIAVLSVFSFLNDSSDWLIKMGISQRAIFPYFGLMIPFILIAGLIVLFVLKKKR